MTAINVDRRPSIRQAAGTSIKSSIFHNWTRDTRDDPIMATKGEYMKLSHEFAGIGGDASFYKVQSETVISRRIASSTVRDSLHLPFVRAPHLHSASVCLFRLGPDCFGACFVPPTSPIGSSWVDPRTCGCSEIIAWDLGMGASFTLHSPPSHSGTYLPM